VNIVKAEKSAGHDVKKSITSSFFNRITFHLAVRSVICKAWNYNSERLLRKQRKTLGGYFILPHLVDETEVAKGESDSGGKPQSLHQHACVRGPRESTPVFHLTTVQCMLLVCLSVHLRSVWQEVQFIGNTSWTNCPPLHLVEFCACSTVCQRNQDPAAAVPSNTLSASHCLRQTSHSQKHWSSVGYEGVCKTTTRLQFSDYLVTLRKYVSGNYGRCKRLDTAIRTFSVRQSVLGLDNISNTLEVAASNKTRLVVAMSTLQPLNSLQVSINASRLAHKQTILLALQHIP